MAWYQAILTIMLANVIVLVPMLLNSHAGTKYGIPYPVFARASFGVFGANLPALMRAGVACGWFGIQTWIGGTAIFTVVGAHLRRRLVVDRRLDKIAIGFGDPQPWTMWLSFAIFWALNILIIVRGMDAVRRFENWAAPFVLIVAVFLLVWMTIQAGGFGPLLEDHGTVGWSLDKFWFGLFPPALMGMIAFWSTLSLNMPDFTRFGQSQRAAGDRPGPRPADDHDDLPAHRGPRDLGDDRRLHGEARSGNPVDLRPACSTTSLVVVLCPVHPRRRDAVGERGREHRQPVATTSRTPGRSGSASAPAA